MEGSAIFYNRLGLLFDVDLKEMYNNAGIFTIDETGINEFINVTEYSAKQIDILCMGFWCREIEGLYQIFSKDAVLVDNDVLPPSDEALWMKALKGKKVLVVHPFATLIEKQYQKREMLFHNPNILPEFTLKVYKAVQSMGGNSDYNSWAEALRKMEHEISKIDFDIALIGCGAYGMPLGAFIKMNLQKQAVHVGGQLQLLFGIKGQRWDLRGYEDSVYNKYWVRPSENLRPANYKEVEGGCYW